MLILGGLQVAMHRSMGTSEGLTQAVKCMNEYLELYPTDIDAWREMADMYLDLQQVEQAKFALEELVLLTPLNYLTHLKLAEALYTLGDYSAARKYYSQSLELNPDQNARAAFGLVLCTTAIEKSRGSKADDKVLNGPLLQCGRQLLLDHYADLKPSEPAFLTHTLVKSWLQA